MRRLYGGADTSPNLNRQQSSALVSRGRKLVLQYTGGSPCGTTKKRDARDSVHDGARYKYHEYGDDSDSSVSTAAADPERRKSATISFLCDRDPINTRAAASFVGVDPDECAYFFEVRSQHACAGAEPHKPGSVGPGSVFAIIFFIAVLVYLVGGVFYQRTVAHARGWRQLPNYSLWSGMWSFISVSELLLSTRFESSPAADEPRRIWPPSCSRPVCDTYRAGAATVPSPSLPPEGGETAKTRIV